MNIRTFGSLDRIASRFPAGSGIIRYLGASDATAKIPSVFSREIKPEDKITYLGSERTYYFGKPLRTLNIPMASPSTIIQVQHFIPTERSNLRRLSSKYTIPTSSRLLAIHTSPRPSTKFRLRATRPSFGRLQARTLRSCSPSTLIPGFRRKR